MQVNRGALLWAATLVIVAGVLQTLAWLILAEVEAFGPGGTGTEIIQAVFGKNTFPFQIAFKLDYFVRGAVILVLGLLTFGLLAADEPARSGRKRYTRWSDDDDDELPPRR